MSGLNHLAEELQVYLVDDARARRRHLEVAEGFLRPAQQGVPLCVALVLTLDVALKREYRAVQVHLHGVVYHQVGLHEGIYPLRITTEASRCRAHGREVNDDRHTCEVLQHHAGGQEGKLRALRYSRIPLGEREHILLAHQCPPCAQDVLQHHLHGVGQRVHTRCALSGEVGQAVVRERAGGSLEVGASAKRVVRAGHPCFPSLCACPHYTTSPSLPSDSVAGHCGPATLVLLRRVLLQISLPVQS